MDFYNPISYHCGKVTNMIIRDKLGWPVEKLVGRPFTNFIRILLHCNIKQTYRKLHKEKYVKAICELYSDGKLDSKTMHIITDKFDKL